MELLKEDATEKRSSHGRKPDSDEDVPEEGRSVVCRTCETRIADARSIFAMCSTSPAQAFPNPYGQMRVIITFRDAESLQITGASTTDFTWFAGYGWRVAYCAACQTHLGWLFEAIGDSTPRSFFGLLKDQLTER